MSAFKQSPVAELRVSPDARPASSTRSVRRGVGTPKMVVRIFKHYVHLSLLVLAFLEFAVFFAAIYAGVHLRFHETGLVSGNSLVPVLPILPKALTFAVVMFGVITAFGLYRRDIAQGGWGYYTRYIASFATGTIVMAVIFYAWPALFLGRGAFGLGFLFALLGSAIARTVFSRLADHEALKRRVLVLGAGSRAAEVDKLAATGELSHFKVIGFLPVREERPAVRRNRLIDHDSGSLMSIVEKFRIDEIVVGVRDRRGGGLPMQELLECKLEGVEIVDISTFFERETGHVQLDSLNASWMVFSDGFQRGAVRAVVKRMFDVAVSSLLLLVTLPIMAVTALLIWLESGFPILYRQARIGECGHPFFVLKFRSMRVDAEKDGKPQWARQNDDRVTRVGRVIRKLRIDELPQIFNVLKGDMSFVGPRPERPFFVDQLSQQIAYYACRHAVKPGITGWSQIRFPYGASVEDATKKLQYDLYYVKNHSLFLDLIILLQTAQVVLFGKGAR